MKSSIANVGGLKTTLYALRGITLVLRCSNKNLPRPQGDKLWPVPSIPYYPTDMSKRLTASWENKLQFTIIGKYI